MNRPSNGATLATVRRGLNAVALVLILSGAGIASQRIDFTALFVILAAGIVSPLALAGISIAEQWPLVIVLSENVGPAIVAISLIAGVCQVFRVRGRADALKRFNSGHAALLAILALALVNTLFLPTRPLNFIFLTVGGALPMAFIGATFSSPKIPAAWIAIVCIFPFLSSLGLIDAERLNPIALGHISWIALYFALTTWKRIPRVLTVAVVVLSVIHLIGVHELGPEIAGGVALVAYALQRRPRIQRSGRPASRRRVKLIGALLPIAVVMIAVGVSGALQELKGDELNNSTVRAAAWDQTLRSATWTGRGISLVSGEVSGKAFTISTHNFVIDAVDSAGWIGLLLIMYVASRVLYAIRTSTHPLAPYCTGIMVANLFSGGLFRSTSLWFAFAFLIAEAGPRRRTTNAITLADLREPGMTLAPTNDS